MRLQFQGQAWQLLFACRETVTQLHSKAFWSFNCVMDTHCKLCDHHANQIEGDCCYCERYKNFRLWLCLASIWMNIMTLMSFDANREKMWQFRPSKKRHRIRNWLNLGSLEKFSKFKKRFPKEEVLRSTEEIFAFK